MKGDENEVIKYLANAANIARGKLLFLDLLSSISTFFGVTIFLCF